MNAPGRLIAVVGPSGVGKDSIIAGVLAAVPQLLPVKRTITRASELGGEDYESVSEEAFKVAVANDAFCLHWQAHGLYYGIPASVLTDVESGQHCVVNLSRAVLIEAAKKFSRFIVIHVTATSETLARRLRQRGRESEEQILARLRRSDFPLPTGLNVYPLSNDGELNETIDRLVQLLRQTENSQQHTAQNTF